MRKSWNYSWRVYPRTQGTTGGGSRVRSAAAGAGDAAGDATSAYGGTPESSKSWMTMTWYLKPMAEWIPPITQNIDFGGNKWNYKGNIWLSSTMK